MNSPPSLLLAVPMYITAYSSTVYQLHNIRCGTIVVFALLKCVVTPEIRQLQFVGGGRTNRRAPVVEDDVRQPDFVRRDVESPHAAIVVDVPSQTKIIPLLHVVSHI